MRAVFRVDASIQIGSGHVMRCLTLAKALRAIGAECHFISRAHPGNLIELVLQCGFAVIALPVELTTPSANTHVASKHPKEPAHAIWLGSNWQTDAEQTRSILQKLRPDLLVVDHYALDERWENALRSYFQKLMVIDDLADRPHQCDLLLDQNLGRQPHHYAELLPANCKVLTGPQYALLLPEFAALRAYSLQRRQQPVFKQLLITMGGVDQSNATGQVLQALKSCRLPQDCRISVVMGLQAPWLPQVRGQAEDMHWPTEVVVNISDMAQRMADSDLAIGAPGITSWERCCLGLPTLMVVLADNQNAVAKALEGAGAAKILRKISIIPILSALVANPRALHDMSNAAARIVNGLGTETLAFHLSELVNS
jgi:UDP-2,4-diacetamido-2,4,6-trideoxy-beta-L-altropyranose hydrolase